MSVRNIVWWLLFFVLAICLQRLVPGVDLLVAGLLVALQEQRTTQVVWIILIQALLQEGMGTLYFGASLIWYPLVVALFFVGRWLFETRNVLFVFLLSACLGAGHFLVISLMNQLQFIPTDISALLDESVLQALLMPLMWKAASWLRRLAGTHEDPA